MSRHRLGKTISLNDPVFTRPRAVRDAIEAARREAQGRLYLTMQPNPEGSGWLVIPRLMQPTGHPSLAPKPDPDNDPEAGQGLAWAWRSQPAGELARTLKAAHPGVKVLFLYRGMWLYTT